MKVIHYAVQYEQQNGIVYGYNLVAYTNFVLEVRNKKFERIASFGHKSEAEAREAGNAMVMLPVPQSPLKVIATNLPEGVGVGELNGLLTGVVSPRGDVYSVTTDENGLVVTNTNTQPSEV